MPRFKQQYVKLSRLLQDRTQAKLIQPSQLLSGWGGGCAESEALREVEVHRQPKDNFDSYTACASQSPGSPGQSKPETFHQAISWF